MNRAKELFRKAGGTASYSGKTHTLYVKGITKEKGDQLMLVHFGRHSVFVVPCFIKYQN